MEWVEVAGRTVDEAKESAFEKLGVAEADAELIVLSEPKTGLFGRTRGEARVRARVRPVGPRPKRSRRSRDTNRSGGGNRSGNGAARRRSRSDASRTSGDRQDRPADAQASSGEGEVKTLVGGQERRRPSRRRRNRSTRSPRPNAGQNAQAVSGNSADGRQDGTTEDGGVMAEGISLEEQAEVAREFIQGLLDQFGLDAAVGSRVIDEGTVELAATGEGLGLLVGPKGSTLAALQDVTRTAVQRRFPTRTDRILVDVAGYRERRAAALQRFAREVGTEVVSTQAQRALEPMSAADRKVVHDTINEMDGVTTRSEGEDPKRYVLIVPEGE